MKTCGEVLVEILEAYGIDTVFGIPGVHTVELYRGLPNSNLTHYTPRHEQGAGFMADGYARAAGRPAACFIISGPGMTNIATAMGQAYADSIPMLVISSVNSSHELGLGEGRLHELPDQSALISGVSVFSHRVLRAAELPGVVARAFAVFESARPGPVHIELPLDVITASADGLSRAAHRTRSKPGPDPAAIERAAALLRAAAQPFAVLGGGCAHAPKAALALVERLGAPTALTVNARGVLPPGHPLSLGGALPLAPVLDTLRNADVVLAVGTELGETDTHLFCDTLELGGKVVRIDIEPEQLVRNALPEVAICSDSRLAMQALTDALDGFAPDMAAATELVRQLRAAALEALPPSYRAHGRFLDAVADALPGVIIAGDSTQPVYGGNLTHEPAEPSSWFNSSTGYGTLGYGLPAALGAKLARPDRPVAALIGDGGLQFTIAELATAVELGLAIPVLLWNNRGYGEIKQYMLDRTIPTIGVDIYTPDFQTIAHGFGCRAERPDSAAAFRAALIAAAAADGPTVIEIDEELALTWWG
ncbi:5-guanidino-2-oxopentanoate decarboxylase [Pikeienuella piscinae]|uniref:5-guanidino-2-oxopentanoate decarboxylase n=1 Tax=Pikeienuella piscinae TaxID=2748098 RepID=A0A7L5C4Y4_9RHOB|nr:5-guanidino-2-oxopentanoate decarboxylase [Pikeienuella piscinae]QIE57019.1 5-guanidino-2-oxopentanoate decarboxylase [Pikeienuella piscinae]